MGKILIIDDDPLIRALAVKRLAADGHQVLTAADGEAGLQMAGSECPDVALVDLMMPKLHGFAVVEGIRRNPKLSRTRIVVCSAKSYPTDMRLAKDAGADRYLVKPYDLEVLARTVAELLGGTTLRVKFWGTRGSIATPGPRTARYGGNTSCIEVRYGEHILVIDAGTGIRELGLALLQEFGPQPIRGHIFIGHTHWDHIQGFPFFGPAYVAGNEFFVYSVRGAGKPLEKVFRGQMDADYFPVLLSDMLARLHFIELEGPVQIGDLAVSYEYLNHPGVAIGFRISAPGKTVAYVSDHEPFYRLHADDGSAREDRKIVDFVRGADLFICEAQYTEEEYPKKRGWGHSTTEDALRMAAQAAVRQLAIFHHDPAHDDAFMDRMMEACQQSARAANYGFACFAAKEGEVVEI